MRVLISVILVFLLGTSYGQSSGIGLHIGSVPNCDQLSRISQLGEFTYANQCYSLGLSYHRFTKKNFAIAFRIQYQNRTEQAERNNTFSDPQVDQLFKEVVNINQFQKEIILFPSIYWMVGESNLKPIIGLALPLSISAKDERNTRSTRMNSFRQGNTVIQSSFESNSETTKSGAIAMGLAAKLGMSYQLGNKIQFRFTYTPSILFQNNTKEVNSNFDSKDTTIRIVNGIPSTPVITNFSSRQISEEQLKGISFQDELFLFSILYQL